jgi:small GTP-binding protein
MSSGVYKVVTIGDSGAGKSSMINFMIRGVSDHNGPTIGTSFYRYTKTNEDGIISVLDVWDCCGSRSFNSIIPSYLRNAQVIFLVYDVTDDKMVYELDRWLTIIGPELLENPQVVRILIANKVDKMTTWNDETCTPNHTDPYFDAWMKGQRFAHQHNFLFYYVSAVRGWGIPKLLSEVIDITNKLYGNVAPPEPKTITLSESFSNFTKSPCSC